MRIVWVAIFLTLVASAGTAQQADPAFLQRAITAVQAQRNLAMDAQAVAEARAASLTDDLAKAQARIKELEKTVGEKEKPQ